MDKELKKKIVDLYLQYGFVFREEISTSGILVFSYNEGYFSNADLLIVGDEEQKSISVKKIREDLESFGFSVKERRFLSLSDTHEKLFDGFFKVPHVKSKLEKSYKSFIGEQTDQLGYDYQFIEPKYSVVSEEGGVGNNLEMVRYVKSKLKGNGARLIILEAAAGFGKTCTSYELLKEILSDNDLGSVLFTELSRNRTVKLFKYILLSEIDSTYANKIKMDLAIRELENGNICLLIDGFDELLTKKNPLVDGDTTSQFKDAESMLETIGDLLKGNAKIILTSRRTAIFSGDEFAEWMEKRSNFFTVDRISIEMPDIKSWLPSDRYNEVSNHGFPKIMLSPFFLGLLRGLSDQRFADVLETPDKLMNLYLDRILDREKTRQDLRVSVSDQREIFQRLSLRMAEYGTLVETKDSIKDFFKNNGAVKLVIEENLARYSNTDNVSLEDLLGKLSNHALLDRSPKGNGGYGFVNEHIFGYLLGCELLEHPLQNTILIDERFVDLVARSAGSKIELKRKALWEQLSDSISLATNEEQIMFDAMFLNRFSRSISACTLADIEVEDCDFSEGVFEHVVFERCRFTKCKFKQQSMIEVQFVGCQFHECEVTDPETAVNLVSLYSSVNSPFIQITEASNQGESSDYVLRVLQLFQRPEKGFITHRLITQVYKNFTKEEYRMVDKALAKLESSDVLEKNGAHIFFVFANINTANEILKNRVKDA